jgi:hypothetical protein
MHFGHVFKTNTMSMKKDRPPSENAWAIGLGPCDSREMFLSRQRKKDIPLLVGKKRDLILETFRPKWQLSLRQMISCP